MKRNIIFGLLMISCIVLFAQTTRTYTMTYERDDFTIEQTENFHTIESDKHDLLLEEDSQKPAIPYITAKILLPDMQEIEDYSFHVVEGQSEYNISLCSNPQPISMNATTDTTNVSNSYPMMNYPFKVEYVRTGIMDGYHIAHFKVSPISYNAYESIITWATSIVLNITTIPVDESKIDQYVHKGNMDGILRNILLNPEMMDYCVSPLALANTEEVIDYIIITSPELEQPFQVLKDWKNTKGIRTKIVTTDSIYANYSGNTNQLKIKNFIKHFRDNHSTSYFLLGGDDNIVPVQGCYGEVETSTGKVTDSQIPTDLFYACLDAPFDWNPNGDSYIGHMNDSVDIEADVALTRLPVKTSDDAYAFIDKLLVYEQYPYESENMTKMLLVGVSLGDTIEGIENQSSSEYRSRKMYQLYIKNRREGKEPTYFYDTNTDFDGGGDYDVTSGNLQEQLRNGYHFIDVETHGSPTLWDMEKGLPYYSENALELYNPLPCIITTSSCLTNAFDAESNPKYKSDPCLSEAFIRNPNNGVVAYLGGSRSGWFYSGKEALGSSLSFNGRFYYHLFKRTTTKFGELVSCAKEMSGKGGGSTRWVIYSVNPIGDPEMPICTEIPQMFNIPSCTWNGTNLYVDTGLEDCTITITDKNTFGENYFQTYKDVRQAVFSNLGKDEYTLCITKHNYIPYLTTIKSQVDYIQREHINDNRVYTGNYIRIGRNVTTEIPTGDVSIQSGASVTISASDVIIQNGFFFKEGAVLKINE